MAYDRESGPGFSHSALWKTIVELPEDVAAFVETSYPPSQKAEALSVLAEARLHDGTEPGNRLLRCAAFCGAGSITSLKAAVAMLAGDWRDVVMCGEYECRGGKEVRVRNLDNPLSANT